MSTSTRTAPTRRSGGATSSSHPTSTRIRSQPSSSAGSRSVSTLDASACGRPPPTPGWSPRSSGSASRLSVTPTGWRSTSRRTWPSPSGRAGSRSARSPTARSNSSTTRSWRSGRTRRTRLDDTLEDWSHWMTRAETFEPSLWFLALAGDELAGFAVCRKDTNDPNAGHVELLGVRRPWRKQGLGRRAAPALVPRVPAAGLDTRHARRRRVEPDRSDAALRAGRDVDLPRHALPRATGAALGSRRVAPSRPLPRLPDTHRGRARAGVPVPLVRPRVLGRPRSRSAGLGRGRRGDGRGGVSRAALPRGGRDRGRHARRADAVARLRAARPARRAGRLLLLARGRDRGALERRGAPGRRLDRCARRPEHAGDVPLGQRLGDAACGWCSTTAPSSRRTWR